MKNSKAPINGKTFNKLVILILVIVVGIVVLISLNSQQQQELENAKQAVKQSEELQRLTTEWMSKARSVGH